MGYYKVEVYRYYFFLLIFQDNDYGFIGKKMVIIGGKFQYDWVSS